MLNNTGSSAPLPYRDSVYILGDIPDGEGNLKGYSLCQVRAYRTAACSTRYQGTSLQRSQDSFSVQCEDPSDAMQFRRTSAENLPMGNDTTSLNWIDIADAWGAAVLLNAGLTDGDAMIARLLTQFFPTSHGLNPRMPSMAETLAVMVGSTLMNAARYAPVKAMTDTRIENGTTFVETYAAQLETQQYVSGPTTSYQGLFYIVLAAVFGGNLLVLAWLLVNRGLITDFCEPANMFALAINSPSSHIFAGSCGTGPDPKQYRAKWFINVDKEHVFIENEKREQESARNRTEVGKPMPSTDVACGPVGHAHAYLSQRRSIL